VLPDFIQKAPVSHDFGGFSLRVPGEEFRGQHTQFFPLAFLRASRTAHCGEELCILSLPERAFRVKESLRRLSRFFRGGSSGNVHTFHAVRNGGLAIGHAVLHVALFSSISS